MKKVLITGAGGQLGTCFRRIAENFPELNFTFAGSDEMDIGLFGAVSAYFGENSFDYCINCAAYTNVENAEKEREKAFLVNSEAVRNLAEICQQNETTLIHFSTDYVFNGSAKTPYTEEDETDPLNVYGASKLSGEAYIRETMENYFIFRTSWLYSDVGHNFFNTIRKKGAEAAPLKITSSQKGTPTNAYDLAGYVLKIISEGSRAYGTYHFSNLGETTWYGFAKEILRLSGELEKVDLQEVGEFRTLAVRPQYSVLNKKKAIKAFPQDILSWEKSLEQLFQK